MRTVLPLEDEREFVEIRRPARGWEEREGGAPLPDWLDLLLCVLVPVGIAAAEAGVAQLFRSWL